MSDHTEATRPSLAEGTLWLVGGRLVGSAVVFAIPVVLARVLEPYEFGTYKQVFLIFGTVFVMAQLGMAESLYYFLPREPGRAGQWAGNAAATLALAGVACVGLGVVFAGRLAAWLHNPTLEAYAPWIAVFLALMLVSAILEVAMITHERHRLAAATYAGSDVVRAALLIAPGLLTGSVGAVLAGAVVFAALRAAATMAYLWRRFGGDWRLDRQLFGRQWRYTLPFAAAVVIEVGQFYYHQYAVAVWFDPVTFAVYAVGCLQIPLVDLLATSTGNVLMVRIGDALRSGGDVVALWHEATDRLALMLLPLAVGLMLIGRDLIVGLFSDTYAASVPIFLVSAAMIGFAILPVDAVLRTYARTRFLLGLNLGRLAMIVASIGWFVATFGLMGALLATAASLGVSKLVALGRVAALLQVGPRALLPWRELAGITAAAILALGPPLLVRTQVTLPALPAAITFGLIYAASYAAVIAFVRPDETRALLGALGPRRWALGR
jgi:O-antigen/teichoic acid export membrane protein